MIRLLLLDVDGCLTDGRIIYTEKGDELKHFNVKDGLAIRTWLRMGHEVAIITGRKSSIVKYRAEELGIKHLYQGVNDKGTLVRELCEKLSIRADEVAAIGDDLNDYKMLRWVGQPYTPNDGSHYLRSFAHVLESRGGDAVVREMIEKIVRENGQEEQFLSFWI